MKYTITLLTLAFLSLIISAQVEQQIIPSDLKQLTAITEPATLMKGFLRTGVLYDHAFFKKVFDDNANKITLPGSALSQSRTLELSVQYGITDRFQANFSLPFRFDFLQQSAILDDPLYELKTAVIWNQKGYGLGDISVGLYSQIIREKDRMPSITARGTFYIPTGRKDITNVTDQRNFDLPTGSGEMKFAVDIQARKIIYPYSFIFITGLDYPFGGNKILEPGGASTSFRSGNIFYLNGGFNFHLNDWLSISNDIMYQYVGREETDGIKSSYNPWALTYQPYIHFQIRHLRFVQSVIIPLKGKYYTADPHYIFCVQYIL